jgi:hypothetical protein
MVTVSSLSLYESFERAVVLTISQRMVQMMAVVMMVAASKHFNGIKIAMARQ